MSFAANKLTPAMTSTNKLPFGQHQDQPENPPSTSSASSEAAATVVVGSLSPTSVMASSNNNAGVKPISCSPTSVTIVPTSAGSSSSASEVTKAATSSTGPNAANTSTPKKEQHRSNDKKASGPGTTTSSSPSMPKPFFLMDWLEEVNPKDLEIARQMLQTPNKKTNPRHQSTPNFGQTSSSPSDSSPSSSGIASARDTNNNKSRSAIALPSLAHGSDWNSHSEDDRSSVCRQLYPASPSGENKQQKQPSEKEEEDKNSNIMRRSTSSTSHGSSAALANPPVRATPAVVKMSPFKRKSIAIGNGWNAKGLQKAKKGSWESALLCWQNALEIREQVLGDSHPDTANTLNNCGIAMGKLGRFDEAIEVLERALEIRAEHYGTRQHPEVAATLHNIGNVLHQAQDRAGAIQCFWDAKLLQEKILGPDHVQVARACVAIGNVYYEALQYDDAREAYHDALLVFTNAGLAADHAEVLAMQQDISDLDAIITAHPYHHAMHHHQSTHPMMMMAAYQHQHYQYHHHHHPYAQGVLEDIL